MSDEAATETVTRTDAIDGPSVSPNVTTDDATSRTCLLGATNKTHDLTQHHERHREKARLEQRGSASLSVESSRTMQEETATAPPSAERAGMHAVDRAQEAKLALAQWLRQEQLPMDLFDTSSFHDLVATLDEQFGLPKREELRLLLQTCATRADGSNETGLGDASTRENVVAVADMLAVRAACRCGEDPPVVSCTRVACNTAGAGEATVHVLRAAASLFDAQTCRGKIVGRNGVLGRSFVGTVSGLQLSASEQTERTTVGPVKVLDRVVASPYLMRRRAGQCEQLDESNRDDALPQGSTCSSTSVVGVSASIGTLAEYIVLPASNLAVVPPSVPDDLALLADDMSVVLSIVSELQRRQVTNVAILSDGPATIVSNLLTRFLHQDVQISAQNLHLFSTTATWSSSVWSQYASVTPLDLHEPADAAYLLTRQAELALDAVVDLVGSKASTGLALSLVQSMGCIVLVDRSRLELYPPSLVAMEMNAVVVRELEIVSVHNCRDYLDDALQYLVTQSQSQQSARDLRACLLDDVVLSQALSQLQTIPEQALEAQYLQVRK
ncbi:unnamed protein product [Hyaloperonospora brassicae]|uniref:Alcohol dehydrogenase-like N-terminal domain-containing protein n=1 Tax=Hyaloperonospora brassicae TaxID=162125 RepID=A0AAV0SYM9_HYABA|nr:unnamed protein product [Hyaloperonospora brassicae]